MSDSNDLALGYAMGQNENRNCGCGYGGFMNGDGIWAILLFGLIFGFGRGGFGGANSPDFQGAATRADINAGFAFNDLQRGIQGISNGICDSTFALNNAINNGFHGVDVALCQGFNGVNHAIYDLGYKLQDCCCQTQRGIDGVNYNLATQGCETRTAIYNSTRDIVENANNNTRAILDFLTQDKISSLREENQALKFQASQTAQNGYIDAVVNSAIARIKPQPIPAYAVPNPNCCNPCGCGYSC